MEKAPHPDLVRDENDLWAFKQPKPVAITWNESIVKVVKFKALTRECPIDGEVKVVSRNFQPERMNSVEELSCGHTLLITRVAHKLKNKVLIDARDPRAWTHKGWRLSFIKRIN